MGRDYREEWEKELRITVEVDARLARGFLKILRFTRFIWYPFRRWFLAWLRRNLQHFVRGRIENYRQGKWFWL